ncbi:MAG: FGGY-family carbohydrate kinase [Pseudomonadota bacterium]
MSGDVIVGLDAGTSVIKAIAFTKNGEQIGVASRPNTYNVLPDGGVEQEMVRTYEDAAAALRDLGTKVEGLKDRIIAVAITGQGDGCWLLDEAHKPVHDGWLWLDGRAVAQAERLAASDVAKTIYHHTATGLNVCQMRTQLAYMDEHMPEVVERAAIALHCKDWLYLNLTGMAVQDTSEATYTFGDYRTRQYCDPVIDALGLRHLKSLLPPIVDGAVTSHPLTAAAAKETGLPEGLPVILGYLDIMCTAIGGGLFDSAAQPGLSVLGSTGVHMRFVPDADGVVAGDNPSGYVIPFPGKALGQLQTNMAATLNIDWMLGLATEILAAEGVQRTQAELLDGLDERVIAAKPGAALFHPYITLAGERGPFADPRARASFTGIDQSVGWFDLVRAVYEGLAFAARDCYAAMGPTPSEIRMSGGAARSKTLRSILAAVLNRPIRTVSRAEAGAAGAAMIAAVQQGLYSSLDACVEEWVMPLLNAPEAPDPHLVSFYDALFPRYVETRHALAPTWSTLASTRATLRSSAGDAP